jgi:ubiquitin conjugation factor E4 B
MTQSKMSADAVILDRDFLNRCLSFYSNVASYLNSVIMPGVEQGKLPDFPLPNEVPPLFANLPEWYVEDIAEFLLFALQ